MTLATGRLPPILATLATHRFKPLHVVVDELKRVVSTFGDPTFYGYAVWRVGDDLSEVLQMMHGFDESRNIEILFVETPNQRSANVRIEAGDAHWEIIFYDMTAERDQRQALQQRSNELSILSVKQEQLMEELRGLNKELDIKRVEAEHASHIKSRFIAGMSHEFRTPLNSIIGQMEFYRDQVLPGGLRAAYDSIERAAKHLMGLVDNLLEQAQLEIGEARLNPQATELNPFLDDMRLFFEPIVAKKSLRFILIRDETVPPVVLVDQLRLRQILINLIGNACKYTDNGSVNVSVAWADDVLEFRIADTGVGMNRATLANAFTPFHREYGTSQAGAGLGLSITKQLLELMGGEITINSDLGVGTSATASVPARTASLPITRPVDSENSARRTVLVVEDDRDVFNMTAIHLANAGYGVAHADRPSVARSLCREAQPAIILLDLQMPEMDGFRLATLLRADGYSNPIVMLTASSLNSDRERAWASGCNEFLVKPVLPSELIRVLDVQLEETPVTEIEKLTREYCARLGTKAQEFAQLRTRLPDPETRDELLQELHKIAGSASIYGVLDVARIAQALENKMRDNDTGSESTSAGEFDLFEKLLTALWQSARTE